MNVLKTCATLSFAAVSAVATINASAQQYTGGGSTNQYGGSQNQYRVQQMRADADRQRRNADRLKEIRWNRVKEYGPVQRRNMPPPNYNGQPYFN